MLSLAWAAEAGEVACPPKDSREHVWAERGDGRGSRRVSTRLPVSRGERERKTHL